MFFPPRDPALARFGECFVSEAVLAAALWNSAIVAVGAATQAVLLALPVAYLLWSTGSKLSKALAALGSPPFAVPSIVFGVGLGFFWAFTGGLSEVWAGAISHAILLMALPLVTIFTGLQSIDRSHLDAAATMGPLSRWHSGRWSCP